MKPAEVKEGFCRVTMRVKAKRRAIITSEVVEFVATGGGGCVRGWVEVGGHLPAGKVCIRMEDDSRNKVLKSWCENRISAAGCVHLQDGKSSCKNTQSHLHPHSVFLEGFRTFFFFVPSWMTSRVEIQWRPTSRKELDLLGAKVQPCARLTFYTRF